MLRTRMGQLLLDAGCITPAQLDEALARHRETAQPLGHVLFSQGAISEETLLKFLGQQYGLATVHPLPSVIDPQLATLVPHAWATQHRVVPVSTVGQRLTVAVADPANVHVLDDLRFRTGLRTVPVIALESEVQQRIQALYQRQDQTPAGVAPPPSGKGMESSKADALRSPMTHERRPDDLSVDSALASDEMTALLERASSSLRYGQSDGSDEGTAQDESPVAQLVKTILHRAAGMGVSDVHVEPYESAVRVRFRLDGVLHTMMTYSLSLRNAVISRLKILSQLDIAERRLPQDGRLTLSRGSTTLDVRLSVLPSLHGEKAVLRLLNRAGQTFDLRALGFDHADVDTFLSALNARTA